MKGEPSHIHVENHDENPLKEPEVRAYERITRG